MDIQENNLKKLLYILILLPSLLFAQKDKYAEPFDMSKGLGLSAIDSMYADFIGQEVQNKYDSAYVILKDCYKLAPEDAELNFQMALYERMFAATDSVSEEDVMPKVILKLKKAYEAEPNNKKYTQTLLNAYANVGDTLMIEPLLERLVELDKNNEQYLTILMRLYDGKGKYEKELELLDRLETISGRSPEINMARAEVLKNCYGDSKALKYVNSLIKQSPNTGLYYLYLAEYYGNKEVFKKALPYYDKASALNPSDVGTRYSYIQCLEKMGKEAEARQIKLDIVNDPKSASELKVQIVRDLLEEFETEENGTERMMQMFRTALEQPQENSDMTVLYIKYMALQKWTPDSIISALDDVLKKEPTNEEAYMNMLSYYGENDNKEKVVDICNRAIENGIDKLEIYYYQGGYNYQIGNKDEALRIYERAVSNRKFANNPKLYADCYGMIGSLYHEKDSTEKAYEAFEECLKWNPDDYATLNNYAYYLSLEDKDLERAEQMSKRTIIAEPNRGIYLDTYAWILFKLGRYSEAAEYINRAVADTGNVSAEEYEHAGDIYYMLKEKEAAVAYWELAKMKAEAEGEDTSILERKIKTKKL